jgi:ribose transport system substrate-binding protein
MTIRIARRAAVLAAIGAAIVGCTGASKDQSAAGGGAAAKTDSGRITIAVIGKSSNNPVFLAARTGAEQAARDISARQKLDVRVNWLTPPQEDAEMQAQRIRQAVNDGADGILLAASDAGKVTGAINDAVDRGVPVMMFDSDAPQSKRFAIYGVDDAKSGETVMKELATAMGETGKVAILAGNQNAPNLQRRVQGVKAEAAKHPGIQIVGTFNHIETPQDAAAEVLRVNNAYPDIRGWAMVGGWPLFTQTLLTDLDPNKQKVVAVDALPAELPYVEKGITPVLLAQPVYRWGYVGVETLVDKIHAKKDPASPVIPMELVRVTKANLGEWARQLKAWGFTDVPQKYLDMK